MSSRSCPDWPVLMERAPELQFKHVTLGEARLPVEALTRISGVPMSAVALCADVDHHVFNEAHTEPEVAEALRGTHWYEVREWSERGPGSGAA